MHELVADASAICALENFDHAPRRGALQPQNAANEDRPVQVFRMEAVKRRIELWMRGGEVEVDGQRAFANCFVVIEPGAVFGLRAPFGACLLAWAEGREQWPDGVNANLFGF
jgi:hypothetical protein